MKKILLGSSVLLVALVIFGMGFAFAQFQAVSAAEYVSGRMIDQNGTPVPGGMTPGMGAMGGHGGRGGHGVMRDYVEQALAAKLGLTEAQIETQQASGKNLAQIALENGVAQADLTAVMTEVHKTALAQAVTAGVLTQAQADAMLTQMTAEGFDFANCPMGGTHPQDGAGFHGGRRGGMMGPGQEPQTTNP